MEDLRKAANYYLETASEDYKKEARKAMKDGESPEDFYIRKTKRCIRKCVVCKKHVVGFYMCCTKCELHPGYDCYNLCVDCFYGRTFNHNHDTFADNHSILMMQHEHRCEPTCKIEKNNGKGKQDSKSSISHDSSLKYPNSHSKSRHHNSSSHSKSTHHDSSTHSKSIQTRGSGSSSTAIEKREKGKGKQDLQIVAIKPYCTSPPAETMILKGRAVVDNEGMEKLGRIAKAHHKAASQKIKNAADDFCRSMFRQAGNGHSLTQNDFLAVMYKKGYPQYADRDLFRMLAKDGNHVTMSEALTLYYIVLSGRPFCSGCEHFIPDMFFCCSKCPAAKYALCLGCYETEAYLRHKRNKHVGENDVFFLDYTVLHTGCYSAAPTPQSPNLYTYHEPRPDEPTNAIVKKDKGKELVAIFSTALTFCTAALNFGAALCTIM